MPLRSDHCAITKVFQIPQVIFLGLVGTDTKGGRRGLVLARAACLFVLGTVGTVTAGVHRLSPIIAHERDVPVITDGRDIYHPMRLALEATCSPSTNRTADGETGVDCMYRRATVLIRRYWRAWPDLQVLGMFD